MTVFYDNSNCCSLLTTRNMPVCSGKNHAMQAGYRKCLSNILNSFEILGVPSERNDLIRRDCYSFMEWMGQVLNLTDQTH